MQVSHFFSVGSTISNWNINQRPRQAIFDALNTLSVVRTLSDLPIFSKCPKFRRKLTFFVFLEDFLSSREHKVTRFAENGPKYQAELNLSYQARKCPFLSFRLKLSHQNHQLPEKQILLKFWLKIQFQRMIIEFGQFLVFYVDFCRFISKGNRFLLPCCRILFTFCCFSIRFRLRFFRVSSIFAPFC